MQAIIRDIKIEDIEPVFKQLRELASTLDLSDRLVTTSQLLKEELFNLSADWFGLVAEIEEQIVGSCLYSISNINREFHSTPAIYIDVLFISEKYRKFGIGKSLINKVATIAKQKKFNRIELWCSKTNTSAQAAYAFIGAKKVDSIDVLRFEVDKLLLGQNK